MFDYRRTLMTLAIGTIIVFPTHAGLAWADDQAGAPATTGAAKQGSLTNTGAADHDGDGVPNCQDPDWTGPVGQGSGYAYQNRNTRKYRKIEQNRYGDMGVNAGAGQGRGFVDEDGDGINDLARDHDGDGLPNGQDPDWVKNKRDGTGTQDRSEQCVRSQHRGNKRSQ